MALREGKTVYMPVPKLREEECFIELDPAQLGKNLAKAATIRGAARYGRAVRAPEVQALDLIVCGSVAVNGQGARAPTSPSPAGFTEGFFRRRRSPRFRR